MGLDKVNEETKVSDRDYSLVNIIVHVFIYLTTHFVPQMAIVSEKSSVLASSQTSTMRVISTFL